MKGAVVEASHEKSVAMTMGAVVEERRANDVAMTTGA